MANHKRKRPRNQRAGCKMCKGWKVNGFRTERRDGERFSDHRRRSEPADVLVADDLWATPLTNEMAIAYGKTLMHGGTADFIEID